MRTTARTKRDVQSKVQASTHFNEPTRVGSNGSEPMQILGFKLPSNAEIYRNSAVSIGNYVAFWRLSYQKNFHIE